MYKETNDFLDFIDKEFIGTSINKDKWKEYLHRLPYIYQSDIAFRLLFEWHWKLNANVSNAAFNPPGLNIEDARFTKQIQLINQIGKNVYGMQYQYNELIFFHARVNLQSKHLLEIGGSFPNQILFDEIGIANYTNIESPDYIQSKDGESYSEKHPPHDRKQNILCNAEDLDKYVGSNSVDEVFSVACFEHIYDLPKALISSYSCLKNKGHLYSFFAPIYSRIDVGDHGVIASHNLIKEKPIGFHLLSQTDQRKKLDQYGIKDPKEIQNYLSNVNFNRIPNRLLYEDYSRILSESPFWVIELDGHEEFNISKKYPTQTKEIRKSNPNIKDLKTLGFRVLLIKI